MNFPLGTRVWLYAPGSPVTRAMVTVVPPGGRSLWLSFPGMLRCRDADGDPVVFEFAIELVRDDAGAWTERISGLPVDITLDPRPKTPSEDPP